MRGFSARPRFWMLIAVLALGGASLLAAGGPVSGEDPEEYTVKAAFVYNFAKFCAWPPEVFAGEEEAIVLGVAAPAEVFRRFQSMEGRTAQERRVSVRRVRSLGDTEGCHVLFVAADAALPPRRILAHVRGRNILTVGENRRFIQQGGIIRFFLEENQIRFEISPNMAERAGLTISSQVLRLARIVDPGEAD